jgi:subtilisin family serine protease
MMANKKLTQTYKESVKGVNFDTTITAIVRTKAASPEKKTLNAVRDLLREEHLATRRADLLRPIQAMPIASEKFVADLENSVLEAQSRVMDAAPQAASLWLAQAVAVRGTRREIEELAGHDDIELVEANPTFDIPEILRTPLEDTPDNVDGSTWGVARIGAPEAWTFGKGEGILVGHLDTGVDDTHPALAGKVPFFQEFDALGNPVASAPHDSDIHGTHTAGTIVGRTFNGTNIGVAPKAQLASALVLNGGFGGTFAQIISGMQWAIGQGVHVINMSLGALGYLTLWNLPILNAIQAGVLVVASIGNAGQGTSGGPGNDPLALGVGATSESEAVAGFSSGQTLVGSSWFGLVRLPYIKPDISAPGVSVLSSIPGSELATINGTSMAAPHVAGTVALIQSAEPSLQFNPFLTRALLLGAGREDLGEAGRDQRYGFGRLDAQSASEQSVSLV